MAKIRLGCTLPGSWSTGFVAVQHNLSGKRRVPADFDGDVAPVGIENMKRVMIDVGHRLFSIDVVVGADVPNWRLSATDENASLIRWALSSVSSEPVS